MEYDFTTLVNRSSQGAAKWELMKRTNPNVPSDIVPFSVADMEFRLAPEITSGLKKFIDTVILGYPVASDGYYEAVIGFMKRRHDWKIMQEWICPAPGVLPAIFTLIKCLTNYGDGIIVQPPVYYPFYNGIKVTGRTQVDNPLICEDGHYTMDFVDLEEKCKNPANKILIFSSPHNPVGRVWTQEELRRLGRICIDNDVIIISDDVHFDIVMPGYHHTVMASMNDEFANNMITCTAPSKTFNLAGMKTSNIIIPKEEWREKFTAERLTTNDKTLNVLGYEACRIAYTQCDDWLDQLKIQLESNRVQITDFIRENIPRIKLTRLEGTYLQWMDFRGFGLDPESLEKEMTQKAMLFLDEGTVFGKCGSGFERINFACPQHVLQAALERLKHWSDSI